MSWLSYSSSYFENLEVSTDRDRQHLTALIRSAVEFVEKFCNRSFVAANYDKVHTTGIDGGLVLDNPPINYITRIQFSKGDWLTISHSTAQRATAATSDTALILTSVVSGVQTTNTLTISDYATITALAAAVDATSFSASANTTYASYPADDIVRRQFVNVTSSNTTLAFWDDYNSDFSFDSDTGIVGTFHNHSKCRVKYNAGFTDTPEAIKEATANLIIAKFQGVEGRVKSESLGQYSYTLDDIDNLPSSDKKVLAYYKDRRV